HLTNWGVRGDVSYSSGHHNVKIGTQVMQTRLKENFALGITDPGFTADHPDLSPFDLTRGGSPFSFADTGNVNEFAVYAQDSMTLGKLTLNPGVRVTRYSALDGTIEDSQVEPWMGISYLVGPS